MVNEQNLKSVIAAIEKRKLGIESKRSLFHVETVFFLPLFAILLVVTLFSENEYIKMLFFYLIIVLITIDVIYSIYGYILLNKKQKGLEELIHKKLGM